MSKQMSLSDAITEIHNACEYYDMVHDTGDEEETKKNKPRTIFSAWADLP